MPARSWMRIVVATVMLVAGSVGCSTSPHGPAAGRSDVTALDDHDVDTLTRSGTWVVSERTLRAADDQLTGSCMAAHGFRYPAPPPTVVGDDDETALIDLPGRRRDGYGLTSTAPLPASNSPQADATAVNAVDAYVRSLSDADRRRFQEALYGDPGDTTQIALPDGGEITVPRSGCEADSLRTLGGSLDTWTRFTYVPMQIDNTLAEDVPAAAAYVEAMSGWRSCMAERGYRFASPDDARGDAQARAGSGADTAAQKATEIAVAVSDGECATASHLPTVALRVRRELAASLPPSQRRLLHDLTRERDLATTRATAICARRNG